jgi:hypothetical protein
MCAILPAGKAVHSFSGRFDISANDAARSLPITVLADFLLRRRFKRASRKFAKFGNRITKGRAPTGDKASGVERQMIVVCFGCHDFYPVPDLRIEPVTSVKRDAGDASSRVNDYLTLLVGTFVLNS